MFGLEMMIYNPDPESIVEANDLLMTVEEASVYPFFEGSYKAAYGSSHVCELGRSSVSKLGPPYSDCVHDLSAADSYDSDLFREIMQDVGYYNQLNCFRRCFRAYVSEKCNCSGSCLVNDCVYNEYNKPFDSQNKCKMACPNACNSFKYETKWSWTGTTASFLEERHVLNSNLTTNNTVVVLIFYNDLIYTENTDVPVVSSTDLISSVGECN